MEEQFSAVYQKVSKCAFICGHSLKKDRDSVTAKLYFTCHICLSTRQYTVFGFVLFTLFFLLPLPRCKTEVDERKDRPGVARQRSIGMRGCRKSCDHVFGI